jgi:hypothetical protein
MMALGFKAFSTRYTWEIQKKKVLKAMAPFSQKFKHLLCLLWNSKLL